MEPTRVGSDSMDHVTRFGSNRIAAFKWVHYHQLAVDVR